MTINYPVAGLGTVKFGRNEQVKYPMRFAIPDDNALRNLLAIARDLGVYLLDTAPAYGDSETRIGQLLTARQQWLISTKVGETFAQGQSQFDFSARAVERSLLRSLKRLKTDYLDVVLIHSNGDDSAILAHGETVEVLQRYKQKGVIRAVGLSGKTVEGGRLALTTYDLDIAMITYNLIETAERTVIDIAKAHNKQIFIKKALASGHLSQLGNDAVQRTMNVIFSHAPTATSVILGTINPLHLTQNMTAIQNALRGD